MIENENVYVGGNVINGWGSFKRNKRDIVKEFRHENIDYILVDNFAYNKALIYKDKNDNGHEILISYNTIVAEYIDKTIILHGYYSQTTARHINEFLYRHGLKGLCKKEIENKMYIPIPCNY